MSNSYFSICHSDGHIKNKTTNMFLVLNVLYVDYPNLTQLKLPKLNSLIAAVHTYVYTIIKFIPSIIAADLLFTIILYLHNKIIKCTVIVV